MMKYIQYAVVIVMLFIPLHARSEDTDAEVRLFVENIVNAFNSRDIATLEHLIGDSWQELLESARLELGYLQMRIVTVSMDENINVTVEAKTTPVDETEDSINVVEVVLKLSRQGETLKLMKSHVPSFEMEMLEFKNARNVANNYVLAVNGGEARSALILLGITEEDQKRADVAKILRSRDLEWVYNALAQGLKIQWNSIRREGGQLHVGFDVTGDEEGTSTVEYVSFEKGVLSRGQRRSDDL